MERRLTAPAHQLIIIIIIIKRRFVRRRNIPVDITRAPKSYCRSAMSFPVGSRVKNRPPRILVHFAIDWQKESSLPMSPAG